MADETKASAFEGWAILELMGHRRLAGYLSDAVVGGVALLRIDVPNNDWKPGVDGSQEWVATQCYSGASIYCITPTTEAIARKVATSCHPAPVTAWELRPERTLPAPRASDEDFDDHEDDRV